MRWQFSSIFPYLFLVSLALLPLSRPPYHAFNFILLCVLGLFLVNGRNWISLVRVRRAVMLTSITVLFLGVAQYISLELGQSILSWVFLVMCVASLGPITYLIERYGSQIVSLVVVGMILIWTQWGIAQFVLQRDLGFNLAGESNISASTSGVAKFLVGNQKFVRAYGPFLHSNTFGGITLLGLVLLSAFLVRNQKSSPQSRIQLALVAFFVLWLGVLVSFSRAVILGGLMVLGFTLFTLGSRYLKVSLVCFLLITAFIPLLVFRTTDPQDVAVFERSQGIIWWTGLNSQQSAYTGFGIGGYPSALRSYLDSQNIKFEEWQVMPVHSVPFLMISELGMVWAVIITTLILLTIREVSPVRGLKFLLWIVPFLPALLLDHYFFTQPVSLMVLLMGLATLQGFSEKKTSVYSA